MANSKEMVIGGIPEIDLGLLELRPSDKPVSANHSLLMMGEGMR